MGQGRRRRKIDVSVAFRGQVPAATGVRYTAGVRPIILLSLVPLAAACSTVPETGRSQAAWFPDSYVNQLGAATYADATGQYPVIERGRDYEMVQRLGDRIARASGKSYEWEFKLLDAPQVANAFALPGGKVAIYSGILPITQNEDALAAVVGHEVAHAVARHGNERMTHQAIEAGFLFASELALESWTDLDADERGNVVAALGVGAQLGVVLPFSRTHESEADEIGLRYLIRAGYDPYEAPRLWERMAAQNPDRPPVWLSTHPDPLDRARELRALIPRFLAEERDRIRR
jgi:predicted Zn-dependent protease